MFANFQGQWIVDADGFAPPPGGGTLAVKHNTVDYTDTSAKTLFTLPKGAVPVAMIINVRTAFNDSGTDLLDVGNPSSGSAYRNDLDVSSAGQTVTGFAQAILFTPLTEDTPVTATFAGQNANASAGLADVAFVYYLS